MASEITASAALSISKNGVTAQGSGAFTVTIAGNAYNASVQQIAITPTQINFGAVATPGYMWLKNLDATNFILVSLNSSPTDGPGNSFAKLKAGEVCLVPSRQTAVYALADTAQCDLAVVITEL